MICSTHASQFRHQLILPLLKMSGELMFIILQQVSHSHKWLSVFIQSDISVMGDFPLFTSSWENHKEEANPPSLAHSQSDAVSLRWEREECMAKTHGKSIGEELTTSGLQHKFLFEIGTLNNLKHILNKPFWKKKKSFFRRIKQEIKIAWKKKVGDNHQTNWVLRCCWISFKILSEQGNPHGAKQEEWTNCHTEK